MEKNVSGKRPNFFWVDYIRAVTIFGVVLIHVAADVITEWGVIPAGRWWSANLYDSLVRGCVPVFIMLSGALLLPVQESLGDFFRKRFNRVFIPFVTWTVLYLIWKKVFYQHDLGFTRSLHLALGGGVWFHLWFIYLLVGLYLAAPVFRVFMLHATRLQAAYLLGIWFVISSALPFLDKLSRILGWPGISMDLPVPIAQGFIGYFILGAFLMKYAHKEWVRWAGVVWMACLSISFFGTGWLAMRSGEFQTVFYDNLAPNIVFYCASFFILAKFLVTSKEDRIPQPVKDLIIYLSKASLGIYLIHPMVIDVLDKGRLGVVLKPSAGHPTLIIPAITLLVYFVSFVIVRIIQRIPYLKRVV